jgi:hypothetical protein
VGSLGSTRWGSHIKRTTVEDSLTLDLGQMARAGHLVAGNSGRVSWSRGEKEIASIRYRVRPEDGGLVLVLQYTCTTRGAAGRDVAVPVSLETQPMRFGGVRWWGRCPLAVGGRPCQRRVCKLYLPPGVLPVRLPGLPRPDLRERPAARQAGVRPAEEPGSPGRAAEQLTRGLPQRPRPGAQGAPLGARVMRPEDWQNDACRRSGS